MTSSLDRLKDSTLHPLADLFILTPCRVLWKAFNQDAITAWRLFTHMFAPLSIARLNSMKNFILIQGKLYLLFTICFVIREKIILYFTYVILRVSLITY